MNSLSGRADDPERCMQKSGSTGSASSGQPHCLQMRGNDEFHLQHKSELGNLQKHSKRDSTGSLDVGSPLGKRHSNRDSTGSLDMGSPLGKRVSGVPRLQHKRGSEESTSSVDTHGRPSKRGSILGGLLGKLKGQSALIQQQKRDSLMSFGLGQHRRQSILGMNFQGGHRKRESAQSTPGVSPQNRESVTSLTPGGGQKRESMLSGMGARFSMLGGRMVAFGSISSMDSKESLSAIMQRVTRGVMFVNRMKHLGDGRCFRSILKTSPEERTEFSLSRISKILNGIAFFDRLNPAVRIKCCRLLRHLEVGPNEIIFQEGDAGDLFYVILEGSVGVHILSGKTHRDSVNVRLGGLRRRSGFMGNLNRGSSIRTSTAAAAAFVSQKLSKTKEEKRSTAHADSEDDKINRRRLVKLLGLHPDQQSAADDIEKQLKRIGEAKKRKAPRRSRTSVLKSSASMRTAGQGRSSKTACVSDRVEAESATEGSASDEDSSDSECSAPLCEGGDVDELPGVTEEALEAEFGPKVAVLQRGNVFGEISLEADKPRTATIRTLKDCHFGVLHRSEFQAILKGVFEQEKRERLSFLKDVPLFSGWSEGALERIIPLLHQRDLKKKECLFDEGAAALQVYFIREGEFEMRRRPDNSTPCWHTRRTPWRRRHSVWCTVSIATAPNSVGFLDYLSEARTYTERAVCTSATGRVYGMLGRELDCRLDKEARNRTLQSTLAHEHFVKTRMSALQHLVKGESNDNGILQLPVQSRSSQSNMYDVESRLQALASTGGDSSFNSLTPTNRSSSKPLLCSITPVMSPSSSSTSPSPSLATAVARSVASPSTTSSLTSQVTQTPPSPKGAAPPMAVRARAKEEDNKWGSLLHNMAWPVKTKCVRTESQQRPRFFQEVESDTSSKKSMGKARSRRPVTSEQLPKLLGGIKLSRFSRKLNSTEPMNGQLEAAVQSSPL